MRSGSLAQLADMDVSRYFERSAVYAELLSNVFVFLTPAALLLTIFLLTFRTFRCSVQKIESRWLNLPDWVFWGVVPVVSALVNAWVAYSVIGGVPRIFDAFNYWFQAKNFSLGQLYASAPPVPEFFRFPFIIIREGKWFGSVYPGFPLLLASGEKCGCSWLINPFLGGITLSLWFVMTKEILNTKLARLLVILGAFSPFFRMMNAIFMSHSAAILWVTLATWMFWRWAKMKNRISIWVPFIAGFALGWLYITRPQAGAVTMPALFLWTVFKVRWCGWRRLLVFIFPLVCAIVFLGVYNQNLTGDFRVNPRYFVDPGRSLGFGNDLGEPIPGGGRSGHDWVRGMRNAGILINLWNSEMFGWGAYGTIGWLTLLLVLVLFRCYRRPETWIFFSCVLLNISLYVFYFTPSPNFGPRYLSETIPATLILSVVRLREVHRILFRRFDLPGYHTGILTLICCLTIVSAAVTIPLQMTHYGILPECLDRSEIKEPNNPSIILIPEDLQRMNTFTWNSPDLSGNIFLPLRDANSMRNLRLAFPGHKFYCLERTSKGNEKYVLKRKGSTLSSSKGEIE
ncbi:hypothetical protein K8T06_14630 [bacterium]|nr:hypothetical protein [bacterium]